MTTIDRRRLLLIGGGLAGAFLSSTAFVGQPLGQGHDEDEEDPGYDLDVEEAHDVGSRILYGLPQPPPRFVVDPQFLPPVGDQGAVASCVSWAVGYGLGTYMLARRDNKDPAIQGNQVSPAYLYSTVRNARASGCDSASDILQSDCDGKRSSRLGTGGTNISMTLAILRRWGSVTAGECPYPRVSVAGRRVVSGALYDNIYTAWGTTRVEPTMKIRRSHAHRMEWERPDALNELKAVLAQNEPLVYGTHIPAGWKRRPFDVAGRPWEHYREVARRDGKPVGHAMLIIGYDDEMVSAGGNRGAILVQNSWGQDWGMSWSRAFKRQYPNLPERPGKGYAWITYEAFRTLAKGRPNADRALQGRVFSIDV